MTLRGIDGRTAIVTGAAKGIGRAVAERLADEGAQLVLVDCDAAVAAVAEELGKRTKVETVTVDIAEGGSAEAIVDVATGVFGALDILVNNAGIEHRAPIEEFTDEWWHRVLSVNLTAPFALARAAAPHLKSGSGSVVNVCSTAVFGFFNQSGYDASKGGLLSLTRSLAVELGPHGVRANAVCPGFIDTALLRGSGALELAQRAVRLSPTRRLGKPEEIAAAVVWLASDECAYLTGQTMVIDGGLIRG